MKVFILKDYEEMSAMAFKIIKQVLDSCERPVLGLATGSTPCGLYTKMIEDHNNNGTSYRNARTVNLDEYVGMSIPDKNSYAYFMRHTLFDHIDILAENTHIPNGSAADLRAECDAYNTLLESMKQDIQVLGLGSNGHIAFNEPGTSFDSVTRVVSLAESTIRDNSRLFDSPDSVPRQAITMGLKNIMNAKKALVLASGSNKAKAVYGMVKGKVSESMPASILQHHSDCMLVCDEAAGSLLMSVA